MSSVIQLLQVLIQAVSEQNLTRVTLALLHLPDQLAPLCPNLLFLHLLPSLLHSIELTLMAHLLILLLLPLLVGNLGHHLHVVLGLFRLMLFLLFLLLHDALVDHLFTLLDQRHFEPLFERLERLVLLLDLDQPLTLFVLKLLLFGQGLLNLFAVLPLVHEFLATLVLIILDGLLLDHLVV